MAPLQSLATSSLLLAGLATACVDHILAPANDIDSLPSESAENPLAWLGANSPYFAGMHS